MLALYLDSGEHVGSETRHRVLISAERPRRIVLDPSNCQEWLNWSLDGRALKPSFLVCRPCIYQIMYVHIDLNLAFLCVDHYFVHIHWLASYAWTGNDSIIMLHADDAVCDTTRTPINLGYGLQTYGQGCSTSVTVSLSLMPRPVHSDI